MSTSSEPVESKTQPLDYNKAINIVKDYMIDNDYFLYSTVDHRKTPTVEVWVECRRSQGYRQYCDLEELWGKMMAKNADLYPYKQFFLDMAKSKTNIVFPTIKDGKVALDIQRSTPK